MSNNNTSTAQNETFVNPIDADKVAENPGLLPYAHTVGGALIKPDDEGKLKSRALRAMEQQTQRQMDQLYKQMQTLADQAKVLQKRALISEEIYQADCRFEPFIGHTYYLYEKHDGRSLLSMIGPEEWGKKIPFKIFKAKVTLLADHTWDVVAEDEME
jgi:hypothetical protein